MQADDGYDLATLSVKSGTKLWAKSRDSKVKGRLDRTGEMHSFERTRGRR